MFSTLLDEPTVQKLAPYDFTEVTKNGNLTNLTYQYIATLNRIGDSSYDLGLVTTFLNYTDYAQELFDTTGDGLLVNSEDILSLEDILPGASKIPEFVLQDLESVAGDTTAASEHDMFKDTVNLTTVQGYSFKPALIIGPTQELDVVIPIKNPPPGGTFGGIGSVSGVIVAGVADFNISNTYTLSDEIDARSITKITLYGPINFSNNVSV